MTEPSPSRPVPGPPRPGPGEASGGAAEDRFEELDGLPVTEHVAIFEAEHARLQDELSTIDEL